MVLFENSLVKLSYEPSTDIGEVAYPDLHGYLIPEVKHSITLMLDVIRSYDVKNLLLDSTRSVISVGAEESAYISTYLATGLAMTRLKKVARLQSPSTVVEAMAQTNIKRIQTEQALPFLLQSFTDRGEALSWLMAKG